MIDLSVFFYNCLYCLDLNSFCLYLFLSLSTFSYSIYLSLALIHFFLCKILARPHNKRLYRLFLVFKELLCLLIFKFRKLFRHNRYVHCWIHCGFAIITVKFECHQDVIKFQIDQNTTNGKLWRKSEIEADERSSECVRASTSKSGNKQNTIEDEYCKNHIRCQKKNSRIFVHYFNENH